MGLAAGADPGAEAEATEAGVATRWSPLIVGLKIESVLRTEYLSGALAQHV
jgi:hypothetical protein